MTDKQKEAIERLKSIDENTEEYDGKLFKEDFETVLNLIQTQQEEIEDLKWKNKIYVKSIKSHKSEIEKKDTLIYTMQAEFERLEDLEDNTDMLKEELKKKDKIINNSINEIEKMREYFSEDLQVEFIGILEILKDKKVIDW